MNRFIKTLLLWLLIATLPIQGMAAAMKASCGPGHHSSMQVSDEIDHHQYDESPAGEHEHEHQDSTVSDSDSKSNELSSNAADQSSASPQAKSSFCSACASCCFGAYAPSSVSLFVPVYSTSEAVVITPSPLVTGFIPAGLERPPKQISA